MPWELRTVEKERLEFVKEVLSGELSKSALCRKYGISRVTGDKWLKRHAHGESLSDRSREPFHTPNKTRPETEDKVLAVRKKHPAWGPRKIRKILEREGASEIPANSTIAAILKRNGYVSQQASQASTPYKRFQREYSNDLWQTDFKGHFPMKNGKDCFPLTVLDDYSRFSLCLDAKENERREGVTESFLRLFDTYGLPESILCDNGNPWGTSRTMGFTTFEVWLLDYDILPIHGRILHPQTQGKEERFHRTLVAELLKHIDIDNLEDAQMHFDQFRSCYNYERPHEALKMGVPSEFYRPSRRLRPETVRRWGYPDGFQLRKVKHTGYFKYKGQSFFLSEAFRNVEIGMRESRMDNCINLFYRNFKIARIDLSERVFLSKKIYRADSVDTGGEI